MEVLPKKRGQGKSTTIKTGLPMITLGMKLPAKLLDRTIFWVNKTSQRIQARAISVLKPLGIDPRHYVVLLLLEEAGPISQKEISEDLNIDPTIMVAIVDDLERLGHARRNVDPRDRRAHAVMLTSKGGRMLEKASKVMDAMEKEIFQVLSEAEHTGLVTMLKRLHESTPNGESHPAREEEP
jgi:DNA-binding MarR family transcriptional regulator